jgi:hypothetical protein
MEHITCCHVGPCAAGGTVPVLLVIVVRCDHSQEYLPTYLHGRQGYWYRRCYLLEWWLTLFVKALGIDLAGRVCSPCLVLPAPSLTHRCFVCSIDRARVGTCSMRHSAYR